MNNILRFIVTGAASAFIALSAAMAELAPGAISVGSVSGNVTFAAPGSTMFKPLTAGTALPQGATVKTGPNSTATVVFSSGSTAAIAADSTVEFTKFEQEAFSGPIPTKGEPSVSNTEINVVNGSVAAKVNKLKKGSSYTVNSPVGAAGVRGTTFVVTFNQATGQLTVATVEGLVLLTARATGVTTQVSSTQTKAVVETTTTAAVTGVETTTAQIIEAAQVPVEVAQAFVNLVAQIAPDLAVQTAQTINAALPPEATPIVVPETPTTDTAVPQENIVVIPDTTVIVSPGS